jgi:5-methylcytosine-specific restriction endonuclease McrA
MRTYCGDYISPQFRRTMICSEDDAQCTSCALHDANMQIDKLEERIEELQDSPSDGSMK